MVFLHKFPLLFIISALCLNLDMAYGKCKTAPKKYESLKRNEVYKGVPFSAGEESNYEVSYIGIMVGYGSLKVHPPMRYKGEYNRVFSGEAKTGEWYEYAYVVHDKIRAFSRPQDFAIRKFYLNQREGTLFGKSFIQEKWLDFNQDECLVDEKIKKPKKEEVVEQSELESGANDALGVVFRLRSIDFKKVGQTERALVFSSQKNWWLDAKVVAFEEVEVPAGKFKAVKLKLQTYIGQELQQKGDVHIWVATDHPSRPMVKINAEIKIGSMKMVLKEFKKGKG